MPKLGRKKPPKLLESHRRHHSSVSRHTPTRIERSAMDIVFDLSEAAVLGASKLIAESKLETPALSVT